MPASRRPSLWLSILVAGLLYPIIVLLAMCVVTFAGHNPWPHWTTWHFPSVLLFPALQLLWLTNVARGFIDSLMFPYGLVFNTLFWALTLGPGYHWLRTRRQARRLAAKPAGDGNHASKRRYQFTLRHLLIAVTVFAILLGTGRAFYLNYIWGHRVTKPEELEKYLGQRVSLSGIYHGYEVNGVIGYIAFQDRKIWITSIHKKPLTNKFVTIAGTLHRPLGERGFFLSDVRCSQ